MKEKLLNCVPKKVLVIMLIVVIAISSMTFIANYATNPENYAKTIEIIDRMKSQITTVTLAADASSLVIAAIPGDATTPLAEKILDISSYLVLAIGALIFEKLLLTTFGLISFRYLIPLACLLAILCIIFNKDKLFVYAKKISIFAIILAFIVPVSMRFSNYVYELNQTSIQQASQALDEQQLQEDENLNNQSEKKSLFSKVKEKIVSKSDQIIEKAKLKLNQFIDCVAVLIVTTCLIPIFVVFIIFWILKYLFGINVPLEKGKVLFDKYKDEKKGVARKISSKANKKERKIETEEYEMIK